MIRHHWCSPPHALKNAPPFLKGGASHLVTSRSLLAGNPAKIIKAVSDEMMEWKTEGTKLYQHLPAEMHESWKICEPLTEIPVQQPDQQKLYKTWNEIKKKQ